jgi:broad specificity phosphatase PhoE
MEPTILLVRHGNTTYDKKVDAMLDPPLTYEGVEKLKRTSTFLTGYKFTRIVASPLQRTMKTADIVGRGHVKIYPDPSAGPWHLGDIMGKLSDEVKPHIQHLENYPDIRAPHGESYRTFFNRWDALVHRMMTYAEANPSEALVCVTHSRNINALQTIIGGNPIGDMQEVTPEASVTLLARNGVSSLWEFKKIWEGK